MTTFKAQFGEDRALAERFPSGSYVEVGAADGLENSNTWHFEQRGWTGVLVEADPERAAACKLNRPASRVVHAAVVTPAHGGTLRPFYVAEDVRGLSTLGLTDTGRSQLEAWTGDVRLREVTVPGRTLDAILEDDPPCNIAFVTIDVEGHELGVLEGFTLSRWEPGVVILERNRSFPDPKVVRLLMRQGYRYERSTGVNDWYSREPSLLGSLWALARIYARALRSRLWSR